MDGDEDGDEDGDVDGVEDGEVDGDVDGDEGGDEDGDVDGDAASCFRSCYQSFSSCFWFTTGLPSHSLPPPLHHQYGLRATRIKSPSYLHAPLFKLFDWKPIICDRCIHR